MAGLNLYAMGRGGLGGVQVGTGPTQTTDATIAAFSPNATLTVTAGSNPLHPNQPFGLATWVGVGAIVLLVVIRHSLPR